MKLTLRFGKHIGRGRLSPEQQTVVERLERDEITPKEAEKLLGGSVRVFDVSIGTGHGEEAEIPADPAPAPESDEDARAREMIERIAREVDEEMRR